LSISPFKDTYITSSADANIAKHPLPLGPSIWKTEYKPIKISATKHSGQQGLAYRSDGRIFATAGWDSHMRVYSAKTLKELAVLKWHKDGCYATAFAAVSTVPASTANARFPIEDKENGTSDEIIRQHSSISTVQEKRDEKAQTTHWLAAGSKDGKVSLWDIY